MFEKIKKAIYSTKLMATLFVVFAVSMAVGTFIESKYGTDTATILIYNTWWFEAIMVVFVINFLGNIKKYNLLKKENLPVLILHLAFILIILGAGVTRYVSHEGILSFREGETTNFYTSDQTYVTVFVEGQHNGEKLRKVNQKKVLFSQYTKNKYKWQDNFKGKDFSIRFKDFVGGVEEGFIEKENGEIFMEITSVGEAGREKNYLKSGEVLALKGDFISLNKEVDGAINISIKDGKTYIKAPKDGTVMQMPTMETKQIRAGEENTFQYRALYTFGQTQFVVAEKEKKGEIGVIKTKDKNAQNALTLTIECQGQKKDVTLLGKKNFINEPKKQTVGGLDFTLSYGSVRYKLPFEIKLNDFIAEKYPGTEKGYKAFESKVQIIEDSGEVIDYKIYMNHILNKDGYRLFQSSFHPDEKGSVLSVNYDLWGTTITYLGYGLLYLGLISSLFFGKTRFVKQSIKLKKLQEKRAITVALILLSAVGWSQSQMPYQSKEKIDSFLLANKVSKKHALEFGKLIIQDQDGRMKPMNTFSSEFLRKISKRTKYKTMDSDQVFLSMAMFPQWWYEVDFFYIKKDNDSLHKILEVEKKTKFVSALDFFTKDYKNKLEPYLQDAYATTNPNQFQKDFKDAYNRLTLLDRTLIGENFKIYPVIGDKNNKWISPIEAQGYVGDTIYAKYIKNSMPHYIELLREATKSGDYTKADEFLKIIKELQRKFGGKVMPSEKQIECEILYNRYNVFENLAYYYMASGVGMFAFLIIDIFAGRRKRKIDPIKIVINAFKWAIVVLFAIHSLGLCWRWYISGHAPWSDAYESMIYVGWATILAGICFSKHSPIAFASTAFVSSMILMVSHWNWLDPSIGNLQPVLNSYWLMIHVAVIVGSYGPFALAMILGAINLVMMGIRTKNNCEKVNSIIKELTIVNELALTVGLVMLTIGNFLGGQWANESWGRYWGWDPKETWALISIMVYAFVIHMRLVPKLRGTWAFNLASVVAFASIMMTYFGVNFYLTGLHSYASGEKVITPSFVYYSVAFVCALAVWSYVADRRWRKTNNLKTENYDI